jgi:anti-anti-sigma regulatory factor
MLKITKDGENGGIMRVNLYGRFTTEYAPEVEKILSSNGDNPTKIALDLGNVTFVDRAAMEFLRAVTSRSIKIENLPSYVARWIKQETSNESKNYNSLTD